MEAAAHLQNGRLSATLGTDDRDLGQILRINYSLQPYYDPLTMLFDTPIDAKTS
jgi:hypothetical protein